MSPKLLTWRGAALALAAGCGGKLAAPAPQPLHPEFEGPPFYEAESESGEVEPPIDVPGDFVDTRTGAGVNSTECVRYEVGAVLVKNPVDIILLLDNSGSMADELEAVEANINVSFATILTNSAVDYRVILISRHRDEPRGESEESSTSICVSSPLSGLTDCTAADAPVFSETFFQYSTKLESTDSFDVMLDTYTPPFAGSEREEKYGRAPLGWSEWLRPETKKVFLEMTDDDEDMPLADFLRELTTLAPDQFGNDPQRPNFVFHSIVGIAEKAEPTSAYTPDEPPESATCTGNSNVVQNAGLSYQELSIATGGLRFPLCQFGAYDVVFKRIAEDVVTSSIACDFPIPDAPAPFSLELDKVAIRYDSGKGDDPALFRQATESSACQPAAFYIENDRVNLCPSTCEAIRTNPTAALRVLFTCTSQIIPPR